MSKAAELAALIGSQSALSNRNLIINGAMQVAQRGTSSTSRDNYFTVDRIKSNANNTDNLVITSSQSTTSPDGFSSSYKVNVDTAENALASDENLKIMYIIEAQDLQLLNYGSSNAKTATLSFYVRSSTTGTYAVSIYASDSNTQIGGTYTINSANTWERKSITFVGNTANAITNDNGAGLQIEWFLAAGSDFTGTVNTSWATFALGRYANGQAVNLMSAVNNNWHITGIQLEVGDTATPFEHRSYGDELARCGRYYQKWADVNWILGVEGTRNSKLPFQFSTLMRANPTCAISGGSAANGALAGTGVVDAKKEMVNLHFWHGASGSLQNATFSGYALDADAEL